MPAEPGLSHDCPAGQVASAQQTPSTQFPEAHSVGLLQTSPSAAPTGVGEGVGVSVGTGVSLGVAVGMLLQKPVSVLSMQRLVPEPQLSATPPEQSPSSENRNIVPEHVLAQAIEHSAIVVIVPEPQQPGEPQLPHGVQPQEQTQHTASATGTDALSEKVVATAR
ncbi:MAG TPA: hypothetical protein VEB21_11455 [Terriglobales bacterium]|nr:hypothetical protein [Terriglobales bacterium]